MILSGVMEQIAYSPEAWSGIESQWTALTCTLGIRSAFMSTLWMRSWWNIFGRDLKPQLLIWRDAAGQTVGICVLTQAMRRVGGIPLHTAWLGATAEELVQSEHNDLLILPAYREGAVADISALLKLEGVQRLRVRGFPPSLVDEFKSTVFCSSPTGFESEDRYVDLEELRESGRDYLKTLSHSTRTSIRRTAREYGRRYGEVHIERAQGTTQQQAAMDELRDLHGRHWRSRGVSSAFLDKTANQFHQMLMQSADSDHDPARDAEHTLRVDLLRLRAGSQTLGVLYFLLYGQRCNLYQCGLHYDEIDTKLAPGLLAHALAIEHYLERGFGEYDFLAGEERSVRYKRSLGAHHRPLVWMDCYVPGPSTALVRVMRQGWRRYRQLVQGAQG